ncbi:hypothetical protein ACA910_019932 [Epithemia clementina (nom. ined.)]
MGRGTKWSPHEKAIAAKAYREATLDPVSRANQRADEFKAKIIRNMEAMSPNNVPPNKYHLRGATSVYSHLKDVVFPDLNKFNHCLQIVELSHPTGISLQQKINIAVALHTKKAKQFSYLFKDLVPEDTWPNYLAWLEVRDLKKFAFSMSSPDGNMETELEDYDKKHPPSIIPQVGTALEAAEKQVENDEVASGLNIKSLSFTTPMSSAPSSTYNNNKKYSRPTGRDVAKATLSSSDNKRNYKEESVSCAKDKEIKKLRMAFERRNEEVQRHNTHNELKYVIELYKDDEEHRDNIKILKKKLLEDTLKTLALKKKPENVPVSESGAPDYKQFDSHNSLLSSEEEFTTTHSNNSPTHKNSLSFIGLGELAEIACSEEQEKIIGMEI